MQRLIATAWRRLRDRQVQVLVGTLVLVATSLPVWIDCVEQFHG